MSFREIVFEYAKERYGVLPDYPWMKYPEYAVFRHSENGKWFALVMDVRRNRLGLDGDDFVDAVNLKVDDMFYRDVLFRDGGIFPGYHMNKEKWITVLLDGTVSEERLFELLDVSFEATKPKKKKPNERSKES